MALQFKLVDLKHLEVLTESVSSLSPPIRFVGAPFSSRYPPPHSRAGAPLHRFNFLPAPLPSINAFRIAVLPSYTHELRGDVRPSPARGRRPLPAAAFFPHATVSYACARVSLAPRLLILPSRAGASSVRSRRVRRNIIDTHTTHVLRSFN